MSSPGRTLLLFTSSYPFGVGEEFIETEIEFLSQHFHEVHIFPLLKTGAKRSLPANVSVKDFRLYAPYSRVKLFLRKGRTLLTWYNRQRNARHGSAYSAGRWKKFNFLMHRFSDADEAGKLLSAYQPEQTVVYSYWFNIWTMVLAFSKGLGYHTHRVLTRGHGGDIDEQRKKAGFFLFRSIEMEFVDRVVPVSAYGRQLLRTYYPEFAKKIGMSRLGVENKGENPFAHSETFRIVTCSFAYALKRLHLVAEVLSHLEIKTEWVHFGEGEQLSRLKQLAAALPKNISVQFAGHVPNSAVIDFYRKNQVDLFMNVSELEGIPVSIMEAISFGIPVTGCKIGGVPEIVVEETGFLLEKDFDPAVVAGKIRNYHQLDFETKLNFREGVKKFWVNNFNAKKNYGEFIRTELTGTIQS